MFRRTLLGLLGLLLVGSSSREAKRIVVPLPESAHPYTSNLDDTQTYTAPGSPANIWVTFDALCETESGYDFIYLFDGVDNPVGDPAGYSGTELAGAVIAVPGDTVKIRFTSDYAVEEWGYRVTGVSTTPPEYTITPTSFNMTQGGFPKVNTYFMSLEVTPSIASPVYTVTAGALPSGLTLSSAGVFGGTPTVIGVFTVTVTVSDGLGGSGTAEIVITVRGYPTKIDAAETVSVPESMNQQQTGPYEYNGSLYGVFLSGDIGTYPPPASANVEIWASADGGVTWVEKDAANHPGIKSVYRMRPLSVVQDGATLWVAYLIVGAPPGGYDTRSGQIIIRAFDLATETWSGSPITGGPWVEMKDANTVPSIYLVRMATGAFTVLYPGLHETITATDYKRARYCTYDNGAWGAEVEFPGQAGNAIQFWPVGAVLGDSGRAHLFVGKWYLSGGYIQYRIRHYVPGTGSDQELQYPDVDPARQTGTISVSSVVSGGVTVLLVTYVQYGGLPWVACANSADSPSWTFDNVEDDAFYDSYDSGPLDLSNVSLVPLAAGYRLFWIFRTTANPSGGQYVGRTVKSGSAWGATVILLWSYPNYPIPEMVFPYNTHYTALSARSISGGVGMFMTNYWGSNDHVPYYYFDPIAGPTSGCRYHGF